MVEHNMTTRSNEHAESHAPQDVAEHWATVVADGDIDAAMRLYAPGATLHAGTDVILGAGNIRRYWESSSKAHRETPTVTSSDHGMAMVSWPPVGGSTHRETNRLHIRHGKIVEQWAGDVHAEVAPLAAVPIELSVSGRVSTGERQAALDMIDKVLGFIDDPALHVRLRLERSSDSSRLEPVSLRATIDLKGDVVRAHVSAATSPAAIEALEHRLRSRLRRRAERRRDRRHRGASHGEGEWRHGDEATARPPYFPRPVDDRQVVRYKTVAPGASTVEEAIFDLDSMDYDFYLFVSIETDADAFVQRGVEGAQASGPVQLQHLGGADDQATPIDGVIIDPRPAPVIDLDEAERRLDIGDERCVFFQDAETQRGHVLYRRYDGHYGLIVPADEGA